MAGQDGNDSGILGLMALSANRPQPFASYIDDGLIGESGRRIGRQLGHDMRFVKPGHSKHLEPGPGWIAIPNADFSWPLEYMQRPGCAQLPKQIEIKWRIVIAFDND